MGTQWYYFRLFRNVTGGEMKTNFLRCALNKYEHTIITHLYSASYINDPV